MAVKDGLQAIAKVFRYGGYLCATGGGLGFLYNLINWSSDGMAISLFATLFVGGFFWLIGWIVGKFAL